MTLLQELQSLPDGWGLVAVGAGKRAYQSAWQDNPLDKASIAAEIEAGRAKAVGALAGPASGGLLFVDHDGFSATAELERLGLPPRDLPPTVAVTSGRDGRFQLVYRVPEQFWDSLLTRRVFKTGATDAAGHAEQLDLRWAGHYSVVCGAHPETTGYRWIRDRSPAQIQVAEAPIALVELLLRSEQPDMPLLAQPIPAAISGTVVPLIEFITRDSRSLVESGGTPGAWNDDQLRLALDLVGVEEWLLAHGLRPDATARDLFADHIRAARVKDSSFDERKAWRRFDGALKRAPQPGTPVDTLLSRAAYHSRTQRPLLAPPAAANATVRIKPMAQAGDAPICELAKVSTRELMAMLRSQGQRLRWNVFTQQVEQDGLPMRDLERFYLQLAESGFKVPKDQAMDVALYVAQENPRDPVREYLDHVAAEVEPTYIHGLASQYLRPEDAALGQPTLYDEMIRRTLIAAVRRAFEPGCKHDSACVLMGDQGARKSSFWNALGGPFFSDALRDISSKDDLMVLHRSWIMEWAELDHLVGRRHAGQVKAFLSQQTDVFRVPYGKAAEAFPRRGIIVGSTNRQTGFLVDETGNRRFWVVPVTATEENPIDTPTLLHDRDAIWSAAVAQYRAGEASVLPPELSRQANAENESYVVDSPWLPAVQEWLAKLLPGELITTERILSDAIEKPLDRQTRADQMAVADLLRTLGYSQHRQMRHGARVRVWRRD